MSPGLWRCQLAIGEEETIGKELSAVTFSDLFRPAARLIKVRPRRAAAPAAEAGGVRPEVVLDAFTELAPRYEATMDHELRLLWGIGYREFVDRFLDIIPLNDGARVLDVATGTAMIPLQIVRRAPGIAHVVGLDITPAMLAQGRESVKSTDRSAQIRLVCGSGMVMPFGPGAFDVVTCGLGMHHMHANQLVHQMKRVLSPGGWLLMADVGAASVWRSSRGKLGLAFMFLFFGLAYSRTRIRAEMDAIHNLRTAPEWRTYLSDEDFTDITIVEIPGRRNFYPKGLLIRARVNS